jgi:hypothetical protein
MNSYSFTPTGLRYICVVICDFGLNVFYCSIMSMHKALRLNCFKERSYITTTVILKINVYVPSGHRSMQVFETF